MTIPVEATEIKRFTPACFDGIDNPPVFLLRSPDDRHIRRYDMVCGEMNLEAFQPKRMHAERRKAIPEIYGDDAQSVLSRFNTIVASAEQGIEISALDNDWFEHLCNVLFDQWPPLARMKAKNSEWSKWAPEVCMTTMIVGWENLKTPFKRDGLYASAKALQAATDEVWELEKAQKQADDDAGGLSYLQLWAACQSQMNMTEEEEKNSPAPSQPSSNQDASTENNSEDGKSIEGSGEAKNASTNSASIKTQTDGAKA